MLNFFQWSNLSKLLPNEGASLATVLEYLKLSKLCSKDTDIVFVESTEDLIPLNAPIANLDINQDEIVVCGTKEDYLRYLKRKQDQLQAQNFYNSKDSSSFLSKKINDLGISFDDFGKLVQPNNFKRHSMKERQKKIHRFILHSPHPYALPQPNDSFHLRHPGSVFHQPSQLPSSNTSNAIISLESMAESPTVPCKSQQLQSAIPKSHFLNPSKDWISQMSFEPTMAHNSLPFAVSPTPLRRTSM